MLNRLILTFSLLVAGQASAYTLLDRHTPVEPKPKREYRLLDSITPALALDEFSIKVMRFGCNREFQIPEMPCTNWTGRTAAEFNLILFKHGFWRNSLHGEGAIGKFWIIGWHWELGFKIGSQIELLWEHHSKHTMDVEQPYYYSRLDGKIKQFNYPVEDSYGIRFNIYKR